MSKLNISKFKKVSSDKDFTIMRHPKGHEIKIAHKALSPKMKGEIENLPHFADGDVVGPSDTPAIQAGATGVPVAKKSNIKESSYKMGNAEDATDAGQQQTELEAYKKTHPGYDDGGEVIPPPITYSNSSDAPTSQGKGGFGQDAASIAAMLAKGGKVDPTQQHLMSGDKIPNAIEKNVVKNVKHRMADGGQVDDSKKTLGQRIGYPGSDPTPTPPPVNKAKGGPVDDGHHLAKLAPLLIAMAKHGSSGGQAPSAYYSDGTPDAPISQEDQLLPSNQASSTQPAPTVDPTLGMPSDTPETQQPLDVEAIDPNSAEAQPVTSGQEAPAQSEDAGETQEYAPTEQGPNQQTPAEAGAQVPQQTPQQGPQPLSPTDKAMAFKNDTTKEIHDYTEAMKTGKITPKTYKDMFFSGGLLNTIGNMFGLLAGAIGGKITGQPNLLMSMMNNEIQNDIDAQKASSTNAQNFLRLNQQHQLQLSQGKLLDQEAALKAQVNAHNQATASAFQDLVEQGKKYDPASPEGQKWQQGLGLLQPMVNASITNRIDQAAALHGYLSLMQGNSTSTPNTPNTAIDYGKMNLLARQSKLGMMGAPTEADMAEMTKEATKVEENRATQRAWKDSFNKLNGMFLAGTLSPQARAAEVNTLSGQLAHQTVNRYNENEAHNQAEGMFPAWNDWAGSRGATRMEKYRKGQQFFDAQESGTPTLNRFSVKVPVQPSTLGGDSSATKSGRPTVTYNGKLYYKK